MQNVGLPRSVIAHRTGGSDRSEATFKAKSSSFHKLAGDPSKGVTGGRMVHALRSEYEARDSTDESYGKLCL